MLPSPDTLNNLPYGKFVLSNLAAKRAAQLKQGAHPLVRIESSHPLTIALAEIAAGKIQAIIDLTKEIPRTPDVTSLPLITEEPLPAELGMLLPALDETEVALVGSSLSEDDHDLEGHLDDDVLSLSDLVDADDAEEDEESTSELGDDTLSLSDIAEEENSQDDDSESNE